MPFRKISQIEPNHDAVDKLLLFCTIVDIGSDSYRLIRPRLWDRDGTNLTHAMLVDKIIAASKEGAEINLYYPTFYVRDVLAGILLSFSNLISEAYMSTEAAGNYDLLSVIEQDQKAVEDLISTLWRIGS